MTPEEWAAQRGLDHRQLIAAQTPVPIPASPFAPLPIAPNAFPCVHRGPLLRVGECDLCGIKGLPFDVYGCSLPQIGECSISKRHSKVKSCIGCEFRQEPEVTRNDTKSHEPTPSHTKSPEVTEKPILAPPAGLELVTDHKRRPATGWENRFRGSHAFLVCGGPSLLDLDLSLMNQRGILTAAVNNAAAVYRPHLWFSVDTPAHFSPQILRDPGIHKFLTIKRAKKSPRRLQGEVWVKTGEWAASLPNVWFFQQANGFDPTTFLTSKRISWGTKETVGRCVMISALRLLFWMGVRTLYLVGADFRMTKERPYAFDESQNAKVCAYQNRKYAIVNDLLTRSRPHFAEYGFQVFNCSPGSSLTAFPQLDYQTAIRQALEAAQAGPVQTRGLYVA